MTDWKIGDAPFPRVRGADGPRYKVGATCAVPNCGRYSDHAHHLWSRSYLGKPYDWIEVHDLRVKNLMPLCWRHHEDVTGTIGGYKAGIKYEPESGLFWWVDRQGSL